MRACSIAPWQVAKLIGCRRRRSARCSITDPTSVPNSATCPMRLTWPPAMIVCLLESAFARARARAPLRDAAWSSARAICCDPQALAETFRRSGIFLPRASASCSAPIRPGAVKRSKRRSTASTQCHKPCMIAGERCRRWRGNAAVPGSGFYQKKPIFKSVSATPP